VRARNGGGGEEEGEEEEEEEEEEIKRFISHFFPHSPRSSRSS
jgi:hypothetical protein